MSLDPQNSILSSVPESAFLIPGPAAGLQHMFTMSEVMQCCIRAKLKTL